MILKQIFSIKIFSSFIYYVIIYEYSAKTQCFSFGAEVKIYVLVIFANKAYNKFVYIIKVFKYTTKNLQACQPISKNGCYASKSQENSTNIDQITTENNTSDNSDLKTESTSAKIEVTTPTICSSSDVGNVPDPANCSKFYLCSAGVAISLLCNLGHEFDPIIRVSILFGYRFVTYIKILKLFLGV